MGIMEYMISQRQSALLVVIINEYTKSAEPVGSKYLEKSGFFGLSSATIRAEMCELEGRGYLAQLHTSSGRVPTARAYRYYVDNLNRRNTEGSGDKELGSGYKAKIKIAIHGAGDEPKEINRAVARVLSELSDNLVITNIAEEDEFYKIGLSSLFELPEFHEFGRAFRLTSFFEEFENLFSQISRDFFQDDLRVFIGRENPVKDIKDETVMFARYNLPHDHTGSLTLVGPIRMDYAKNIGLIKYATQELNKLSKEI